MNESPKLSLKHVLIILSALTIILVSGYFIVNYDTIVESNKQTISAGLTGDVSIGTLLPITGVLSSQGGGDKIAINLAAEDFNEYLDKNNALWRLKIVHEDSATNPVTALEKITSLYAKNINMVIGPTSSAELLTIRGYVNSNNMLAFSQSSTAPSLAIPGDAIFRLTPDDTKQGPAITSLLNDNDIDVIIQLARSDPWGYGLSKNIEKNFLETPGHVSQIIQYNPDSPEFSVTTSLLEKAVNEQVILHGEEKVGVVIIGFAETLQFMQSATQHDILDNVRWFGTDGVTEDDKITNDSIGSEFAETVQFTTTLLAVSDNDIRKDVEKRIVSQLGKTPKSYAYSAYDIVWILGLAIDKSQSSDVDIITPIISDIAAEYNGAVGNAKLNEAGDLDSSDYDIWQVSNDSWNVVGYYDSDSDSIAYQEFIVIGRTHTADSIKIMENEIKDIVEKTKSEYDSNLSSITTLQFGEYYSFVLSADLDEILVHPRNEVIGNHPTGLNNGDISVEEILETLKTSDGVWVKYVYQNPATGNEENKKSWLSMHEGYIFAAGYYNP